MTVTDCVWLFEHCREDTGDTTAAPHGLDLPFEDRLLSTQQEAARTEKWLLQEKQAFDAEHR